MEVTHMREIPLPLWLFPQATDVSLQPSPARSASQLGTAIAVPLLSGPPVLTSPDAHKVVREKAIRIAIRTGWIPDLDLIWKRQERSGLDACYGSPSDRCHADCELRESCRYVSAEPVDSILPTA